MNVALLERLSNAYGPPGSEDEVREVLKAELEGYADETRVDKLGNIMFWHRGKKGKPLVMLAAHMDEVGFLVRHIEEQGYLRIHSWGVVPNLLPGQRLLFRGKKGDLKGIIGTKPPHIMSEDEKKKPIVLDDLFVDIGTCTREEAEKKGAYVGMTGVFEVDFVDLGDGYYRGKALDDRAGCLVMTEVFKSLKGSPLNVVAVGTVQEEVGLRGSKTAAYQVDPDYGLALEGTFAVDMPGMAPHMIPAALKKGPVVTIADASIIAHPKVFKTIVEAAEAGKIPYQFKKIPSGGTDAGSIHLTKGGIPSGTIAVPCRYIHGPAAITTTEDVENTIKLVKAFVERLAKD
ncbi:TPA: M42 family metallopeptidase [Candidatus Bathyarchaeota archaeon]|nr:M42 family metallopeptidase [Candidatus Bathyarchaeota archaeon]